MDVEKTFDGNMAAQMVLAAVALQEDSPPNLRVSQWAYGVVLWGCNPGFHKGLQRFLQHSVGFGTA